MGLIKMDDLIISDVGRIKGILKEKNLHLGQIPRTLHPPFDIRYPYEVALMNKDNECVGIVSGGYKDLLALTY